MEFLSGLYKGAALSEAEIVEAPQVPVVDVSGYDAAIKAKEELREYVSGDNLSSLEAEIAGLRERKATASSAAELKELERYRRKDQEERLRSMLGDDVEVDIDKLPGKTFDEKAASLEVIRNLMAKKDEKVAELEQQVNSDDPTPQQLEAHGTPIVPGSEPVSEDHLKALHEAASSGNVTDAINNPAMKDRLAKLLGFSKDAQAR